MPLMAEIGEIARMLGNVLTAEPVSHGALTVVPVLAPMRPEPPWLTLAETDDRVRVTEVDEAGAVPHLKVANLAEQPVLLSTARNWSAPSRTASSTPPCSWPRTRS